MAFGSTTTAGITTVQTVYTPTAGKVGTVIGLSITPTGALDSTFDVLLNDVYLLKGASVSTGSLAVPVGGTQKVVLNDGDLLKVLSNNTVDVITSYLE